MDDRQKGSLQYIQRKVAQKGVLTLIWKFKIYILIYSCIGNFSIAMKKHHGQGNLQKKALTWPDGSGWFCSWWQSESIFAGRSRNWGLVSWSEIRKQREQLEMVVTFRHPKPVSSNILPLTRLTLLKLPKHHHQRGSKHSNIWAWSVLGGGGILIQITTKVLCICR